MPDTQRVLENTPLDGFIRIDLAAFNREIRGRRPAYFPRAANPSALVYDWNGVNRLLEASGERSDAVDLVKDGNRLPKHRFVDRTLVEGLSRISPAAVSRAFREGYSLVVTQVQNSDLRARPLAEAFTAALGEYVGLNIYASYQQDKCFATHWDNHDVFIIQTEGEKEWAVFEQTREFPLKEDLVYDLDVASIKPYWSGLLKKGDILYIPRGWWHHAASTGKGSVHITVGFTNRRPIDFLYFLSSRAAELDWVRQDFGRDATGLQLHCDESDLREKLTAFIDDVISQGALREFMENHLATLPPKQRHSLPLLNEAGAVENDGRNFECLSLFPSRLKQVEDGVCLEFGKRQWVFAAEARPILDFIFSRPKFTLSDVLTAVGDAVGRSETISFWAELIGEGVIGPSHDASPD